MPPPHYIRDDPVNANVCKDMMSNSLVEKFGFTFGTLNFVGFVLGVVGLGFVIHTWMIVRRREKKNGRGKEQKQQSRYPGEIPRAEFRHG